MAARFQYRAWDGAQRVAPLTPEEVLAALADQLLSGGLDQALDAALHRGLTAPDGAQLGGLDALRDAARAARRALLDELTTALREAGGSQGLDDDARRLLDALQSNPAAAARLLATLNADDRATLEGALSGRPAAAGANPTALGETGPAVGARAAPLEALSALDELETALRRVRRVEDVADVDPNLVRAALGQGAAEQLALLGGSLERFAASGYLSNATGRPQLSARALQFLGDWLLEGVLRRLADRQPGDHRQRARPAGHELTGASRPYQFGDALSLDLSRTVLDAVKRGGTPVRLDPRDFAVFEHEESSRATTLLAIDLSRSMGERGYLLAAKRLALALTALLRQRYPRDELLLLGFSETARLLTAPELPALTWDRYGFGTNVQDALRLARGTLARRRGRQRNVILITDGEPTAHRDAQGVVRFEHPPTPATLAAAYAEAERLRRDGIGLAVCVLSEQRQVVRFADELTRRAAGDLLVATPDDLGVAAINAYGRARRRTP
jgi:uncharacterized protein with von Willebrand factor type A (vWA) domain